MLFSVSHRPALFPGHWPSCSFAQHRLVAITQTAHTDYTPTYVRLPCIVLFYSCFDLYKDPFRSGSSEYFLA